MVADDVADHHVVEAERSVVAQLRDDGCRAPDEELVHARAAVALCEDALDDGLSLRVALADVDVAPQYRLRDATGVRGSVPVGLELGNELFARRVLAGE